MKAGDRVGSRDAAARRELLAAAATAATAGPHRASAALTAFVEKLRLFPARAATPHLLMVVDRALKAPQLAQLASDEAFQEGKQLVEVLRAAFLEGARAAAKKARADAKAAEKAEEARAEADRQAVAEREKGAAAKP